MVVLVSRWFFEIKNNVPSICDVKCALQIYMETGNTYFRSVDSSFNYNGFLCNPVCFLVLWNFAVIAVALEYYNLLSIFGSCFIFSLQTDIRWCTGMGTLQTKS